MREPRPRLPCPVCLSTVMERVAVGPQGALEVDRCRRCHGVWLEHGEVRRLRAVAAPEAMRALPPRTAALPPRCHGCHEALDRGAARCGACGRENRLDCPACARPMTVAEQDGLRLDVCRGCRGAWFDAHEIGAVWSAAFAGAAVARGLEPGRALAAAGEVAGETALHVAIWAPETVVYGAMLGGEALAGAAGAVARAPAALASAPEAAAGVFGAIGDAAGAVFEVLLGAVSAVFEGLG